MQAQPKEVYCTLLVDDTELEKASVLAHTLKRGGTRRGLAVLVTPNVSALTRRRLRQHFRHVVRIPQTSTSPTLLAKIHLWAQSLFSRIVFLGIDTLAARAPDELFELPPEVTFAAAPLSAFQTTFSSQVMLLTPCHVDFERLKALAHVWPVSDDDDAVLNAHFDTFHSLSRMYNLELNRSRPQYMPAVAGMLDTLAIVRFGGKCKPCDSTPRDTFFGNSAFARLYSEFASFWWDMRDESVAGQEAARHHRVCDASMSTLRHKAGMPPTSTVASERVASHGLVASPSLLTVVALLQAAF